MNKRVAKQLLKASLKALKVTGFPATLILWGFEVAWQVVLIPFLDKNEAFKRANEKNKALKAAMKDAGNPLEYIKKRNEFMRTRK